MNKKIIIFSGDPISINSEIIYKSWKKISNSEKKRTYIISNYDLMKKQFKTLKYPLDIIRVKNIYELPRSNKIKILDIDIKFKKPFKISQNECAKFVKKSLNYAHKLSLSKNVIGLINCPINKRLLGNKKIGLTEFLAKKCKIKKNSEVMLISNKKFSVSPITTHIDLKEVSKKINSRIIFKKIKTLNSWFKKYKKIKPKICILGLNPHNSEFRRDSEEKKIIIPAIKKLKKEKINLKGPFSADTIFIKEYKKYNVVVGMFHDQVITPFKTIFKFDAINVTLGLKYLRVSPDHGVASNLIGKRKANPISLINCIKFVSKFEK